MNETELLFTDILNYSRDKLYINLGVILPRDKRRVISEALKRRIKGEPIQYVLRKAQVMGWEFRVNKDVFIPRPETEILVETALKIGHRLWVIGNRLKVLDIGTGCGNIAISIAKFLPDCKMFATDISPAALEVAKFNARLNGVKVDFIQSDLFDTYQLQPNTYDLIVSNPPYIPTAEIEDLSLEVRYEPRIALDGGRDGLDFYRRIIMDSGRYLKSGGFLIMEIGFGQCPAIKNIFKASGNFQKTEVIKDYNNIDRVIVAQRKQ